MTDVNMKELTDLYSRMCTCRECQLPKGYCPQLRPPGPKYQVCGIVFVQINPGHIGSMSSQQIARRYSTENTRNIAMQKAQETRQLVNIQEEFVRNPGDVTYRRMRDAVLRSISERWGWPPGKYGSTIRAHGVPLETTTVINLVQCPVPGDSYRRRQLDLCWSKWTSTMLRLLQPAVVVAQGKQVWNFLHNRQLPSGTMLLEGLHHADRRSREVKEQLFSAVRDAISGRA
jgi:hypothetical protein